VPTDAESPATLGVTPREPPDLEIAGETPQYSLRRLVRGAGLYSTSDIVLKTVGFFLVPVYTSVLTPSDYGIVGFAQAVVQILSPLIGLSLISSVPVLFYAHEGEERARLISTVVNFMLLTGLVTTLVLLLVSEPVFNAISSSVPFDPYMILALVTIYVTTMEFLPLNVFNMQDRPGSYALYAIALGLFGVAMNLILVVALDLGAEGVLISGVIAGSVGMVAAGFVIRKYWRPVIERAKLRETFHIALPALPNQFSGTIARFADRLFLAGTTTLAATGVYSLAVTFSTVALMILGGFTTALNPLFYRRANAEDPTLKSDWSRLATLFAFGIVMVGLAVALLGPDAIVLLTPDSYHGAADYVPLLVVGQLLVATYWFFSPAVGYRRKMWAFPTASFAAVAVNLTINAILVPKLGGKGAAIALVTSSAVQLVIFGSLSQRFFPIRYDLRRIGTAVVVGGVIFAVGQLIPGPATVSVGLDLVLIATVPVLLLATGFFTRPEIDAVRRALREARGSLGFRRKKR
jgi:O-antigen/teichoic acid export membrane protein